jgi:hypothetical protein
MKTEIQWEKFDELIYAAMDDRSLRKALEFGTPHQKMEILKSHGFTFEEMVEIHEKFESIIYKGSIPWWFW